MDRSTKKLDLTISSFEYIIASVYALISVLYEYIIMILFLVDTIQYSFTPNFMYKLSFFI